jgi:hypothetical protein
MAPRHSSKREICNICAVNGLLWLSATVLPLEPRAGRQQRDKRTHPFVRRRRVISQNERLG